jgi:hypothetical protein
MSTDPGAESRRDPIADLLTALAGPLGQLLTKLNVDHVSEVKSGVTNIFGTLAHIQQSLVRLEHIGSELNQQLAAIRELLGHEDGSGDA